MCIHRVRVARVLVFAWARSGLRFIWSMVNLIREWATLNRFYHLSHTLCFYYCYNNWYICNFNVFILLMLYLTTPLFITEILLMFYVMIMSYVSNLFKLKHRVSIFLLENWLHCFILITNGSTESILLNKRWPTVF